MLHDSDGGPILVVADNASGNKEAHRDYAVQQNRPANRELDIEPWGHRLIGFEEDAAAAQIHGHSLADGQHALAVNELVYEVAFDRIAAILAPVSRNLVGAFTQD